MATMSDADREGAVYVLPAGQEGYEEILSEDEKEFRAFKDEMGDASTYAKILVARRPIDSVGNIVGRNTFQLFECGLTDYTFSQLFSRIRDQHGTGLYQIQGRDKEGKIRFNKTIGIEAPKDPNATKNNPESIAGVMSEMRQAMMEQQMRTEQMMRDNKPQSQGGSMIEMMTGIAMLMKELRPPENPQALLPPKSFIETLTEMKLAKDLVGDLVSTDGTGQPDNFWSAITEAAKSFGPPLMQAVAEAQKDGIIDQDGVIQAPALPAPPETEAKPDTEAEMNLKQVKEQMDFLVIQAQNNVEYSIVIDFILDQLPQEDDSAFENLEAFLQQEHCIDRCAMVTPEINNHREWFIGWRDAMLEKLRQIFDAVEAGDDLTPYKPPLKDALTKAQEKTDDSETDAGDPKPDDPAQADALDDAPTPIYGNTGDVDVDTGGDGGDLRDTTDNVSASEKIP